jgi:hypothetical protein
MSDLCRHRKTPTTRCSGDTQPFAAAESEKRFQQLRNLRPHIPPGRIDPKLC